ncbi:lactococcin 972 family bacteriocin [Rossellomorea aquimaris]|jgi:hypothetical protein|uniref:lactococcin 972 family bacteriocin n=1 Tax=Rossellomorea aquimaris TaxID=189382 RepID=UPI0011E8B9DB|nr:lactococcin 972 family bacteriocin [Rossellomorea aquimaris]TYS89987.1 hypothetical protein FZC88_10435 [Rossellomorea aquimaris]
MKKKLITFSLLSLLIVSAIIPLAASAAETWDYGYDKTNMRHYNHYYHSSYSHYTTTTKNGITYFGPTASPGYWSRFYLDYTGPYKVTFNKYIK